MSTRRRRLPARVESNERFDENSISIIDTMQPLNYSKKESSLHDSWSNSSENLQRGNLDLLDTPAITEVTTNPTATHRPVSEFMVDDRYYGRVQRDIRNKGKTNNSCLSCCASFSVVGVLFMVFVGVLIEKQPLYLKGIPSKQYYANKNRQTSISGYGEKEMEKYLNVLGDDYDENDPNHVRRRLAMIIGNVDLTMDKRKQKENPQQKLSSQNENEISHRNLQSKRTFYFSRQTDDAGDTDSSSSEGDYYMHEMAKTSFATAGAYFLTLVLCLVYASSNNRVRTRQFIFQFYIQLRQVFGSLSQKYRAKNYVDIPESQNISEPKQSGDDEMISLVSFTSQLSDSGVLALRS